MVDRNDYLQFLCEHGAVGLGLMAILVVILLRPLWGGWRCSPTFVFAALGVFMVLLQALWDCPLRCPSVLMTLFGLLAAAVNLKGRNEERVVWRAEGYLRRTDGEEQVREAGLCAPSRR